MGESRVYYGWWIVAGLFVVLTVPSRLGFNLFVYMIVLAKAQVLEPSRRFAVEAA